MKNLKEEYLNSLKSSDTEEHIDLYFYRPLGFLWACFFRKINQSPNVITILSIFLGIGAGILFYPDNILINIIGIILLVWANIYDSADGQLARMTKQYSEIGRILDGLAGDLWFLSIYICIVLRTCRDNIFFNHHPYLIWIIACLAGISHILQSSMADRFRQFHLYLLNRGANKELTKAEQIKLQIKERHNSFLQKFILWLYWFYTRLQEKMSPNLNIIVDTINERNKYKSLKSKNWEYMIGKSFPLCKWENFLTFNWRTIFLIICILIGFPWIYFLIEISVFNIVLLYLIVKQNKICYKSLEMLSN